MILYKPTFELKLNDLEKDILHRLVVSSQPLSPYDIKKELKKSYSSVHHIFSKLYGLGLVSYCVVQNEKGADKKLYQPNFLGYCLLICILNEGVSLSSPNKETIRILGYAKNVDPFFDESIKWIKSFASEKSRMGDAGVISVIQGMIISCDEIIRNNEEGPLTEDLLKGVWTELLFLYLAQRMLLLGLEERFFNEIYPIFRASPQWPMIEVVMEKQKADFQMKIDFINRLLG